MAKPTEQDITDAFAPYLEANESVSHAAYGVKQPNMLYMLPLFALAILPGAIATGILTKHYLVGITQNRLIVLRTKGFSNINAIETQDYALADFANNPAKTKTGGLFTHIKIEHAEKPFAAKFHRAFSKQNRPNAIAITEAISGNAG